MNTTATHIPKGSMCMACAAPSGECKKLPFDTMPVIKTYPDGVKAVRCTGFVKAPAVQWLPADDTEGGAV